MRSFRLAPLVAAALLLACTDGTPVAPRPHAPSVASIRLTPATLALAAGDTAHLHAAALDSAGNVIADSVVRFAAADSTVVRVAADGLVTALSPDSTVITASAGGRTAQSRVSVRAGGIEPERSGIGVNLAEVNDWSTAFPFVDVFRTAREWISQKTGAPWGEGGPLRLTPEGWVASLDDGQYAMTPIFPDSGVYPAGQYVVLYDGDGTLEFPLNDGVRVASRATGRIVLEVTPRHTLWLSLTRTNAANPLRNIRVIMPGFEASYATQPFNPEYLRMLAPFRAIRFMDWGRTNNSPVVEWVDRAAPSAATYSTERGVPLEVMVDLANTLGADPWFCIPHRASDDYARQFARLVRARLRPGARVYVEYSNEVWNGAFAQSRYAQERGAGLSANEFQAGLFFYARRSRQLFDIVKAEFGADSARVIGVLASQAANPWVGEQVLDFENAYQHAGAFAIAPYFYGDVMDAGRAAQIAGMSEDAVVASLGAQMRTEVRGWMDGNARLARTRGLPLVAYEGGQHLVSAYMPAAYQDRITALFTRANRNPGMRATYTEYLESWRAAGGGMFMLFNDVGAYSKWGSWGLRETLGQPAEASPKLQGVLDFAARYPRGTVAAR